MFFNLSSWIRKVSDGKQFRSPITKDVTRTTFRPEVFLLEDRIMPALTLDSPLTNIYTGDTIPFTATLVDPGPAPLRVEWDFNYGGSSFNADSSVTGSYTPTHTFAAA